MSSSVDSEVRQGLQTSEAEGMMGRLKELGFSSARLKQISSGLHRIEALGLNAGELISPANNPRQDEIYKVRTIANNETPIALMRLAGAHIRHLGLPMSSGGKTPDGGYVRIIMLADFAEGLLKADNGEHNEDVERERLQKTPAPYEIENARIIRNMGIKAEGKWAEKVEASIRPVVEQYGAAGAIQHILEAQKVRSFPITLSVREQALAILQKPLGAGRRSIDHVINAIRAQHPDLAVAKPVTEIPTLDYPVTEMSEANELSDTEVTAIFAEDYLRKLQEFLRQKTEKGLRFPNDWHLSITGDPEGAETAVITHVREEKGSDNHIGSLQLVHMRQFVIQVDHMNPAMSQLRYIEEHGLWDGQTIDSLRNGQDSIDTTDINIVTGDRYGHGLYEELVTTPDN